LISGVTVDQIEMISTFNIFLIKKNRPRNEGFQKTQKIISLSFKVLVLRHYIPVGFPRWFLD
jgi:hypothetical protein